MGASSSGIAEFYKSLSLLLKSELPLSGSVLALSQSLSSRRFKRSLEEVSKGLSEGRTLAASMRLHPGVFPESHVKMLEGAESSGALVGILNELSSLALLEKETISRLRGAILIPSVSTLAGIAIFLFALIGIIPKFKDMIVDILGGVDNLGNLVLIEGRVPLCTRFILRLSDFACAHPWMVWGGFLAVCLLLAGLMMGVPLLERAALAAGRFLPFASKGFESFAWSRAASMISLMLKRGAPFEEALLVAGDSCGHPRVASRLADLRRACIAGRLPKDAADKTPPIFKVALAKSASSSSDMSEEMDGISSLFAQLGRACLSRWFFWAATAATAANLIILSMAVLGMFLPLISIIDRMCG